MVKNNNNQQQYLTFLLVIQIIIKSFNKKQLHLFQILGLDIKDIRLQQFSPKSNENNDSITVLGYTDVLTYTASKPVQIVILQKYSIEQSQIGTDKFGSGVVTS